MSFFKQIKKIFNKKKDTNQNWWNEISTESYAVQISIEETMSKVKKVVKLKKWYWPVKIQKVTSPYGWRRILGRKRWHNGVDYSGRNKIAYAPCEMVIKKILMPDTHYPVKFRYNPTKGKFEKIKNIPKGRAWTPYIIGVCAFDENIRFAFKHVKAEVKVGDVIKVNKPICSIGNWGYSMGAHLHFEIHLKNRGKWQNVNPVDFLQGKIQS